VNSNKKDYREWIENSRDGSYSFGTTSLIPLRRYHLLLVGPDNKLSSPLSKRVALLNSLEVYATNKKGDKFPLSTFAYRTNNQNEDITYYPDGTKFISDFFYERHPCWIFTLPSQEQLRFELILTYFNSVLLLKWHIPKSIDELYVRPLFSLRDHHQSIKSSSADEFQLHQINSTTSKVIRQNIESYLYADTPLNISRDFYYNFTYPIDCLRGYPGEEDLFTPGFYNFKDCQIAHLALSDTLAGLPQDTSQFKEIFKKEYERREKRDFIDRIKENFILKTENGATILAGYPWFGEWGRDTFIAIRGLLLSDLNQENIEAAYQIFLRWGGFISHGMLPNHFPTDGQQAEYNSIDAPLWYVVSACEFLTKVLQNSSRREELINYCLLILEGYSSGTNYNIHADPLDGLIYGGEKGYQLTWMDAKVGEKVITPRIGKPIEVQALWINALVLVERLGFITPQLLKFSRLARHNFEKRFWYEEQGYLADVIDQPDLNCPSDFSLRPNQIFAVGGLPIQLIFGERARKIVGKVEEHLLTPYGLRTLSFSDKNYRGVYQGTQGERDCAYHQGTVWSWLLASFIQAKLRILPQDPQAKEALKKLLEPLRDYSESNNWMFPEIFDGDAPHCPKGAVHQAWSASEYIRALRCFD
jgi:predicted glycogen debranching enzyme